MDWLAFIQQERSRVSRETEQQEVTDWKAEAVTESGVARVSIVGPISWLFGIDTIPIIEDLLETRPSSIELYVDSPGGSVMDAMALRAALDTLSADGTSIRATGGGIVGSAATFVYLAAEERIQQSYTRVLIHEPSGWHFVSGTAAEMREQMDSYLAAMEAALRSMRAMYESSMPNAPLDDWLSTDTWLTAEQALEYGFSTSVSRKKDKKDEDYEASSPLDASVLNYWKDVFNRGAF